MDFLGNLKVHGLPILCNEDGITVGNEIYRPASYFHGGIDYDNVRKYIDGSRGDDNNPGTDELPWATMQKFFDELSHDTSIRAFVYPGTYDVNLLSISDATIHITQVIKAEDDVPPVIRFINEKHILYSYNCHWSIENNTTAYPLSNGKKMTIGGDGESGSVVKCENGSFTVYDTIIVYGLQCVGTYIGLRRDVIGCLPGTQNNCIDMSGGSGYIWDCVLNGLASTYYPLYVHNGASIIIRCNDGGTAGGITFNNMQTGTGTACIHNFGATIFYFDTATVVTGKYNFIVRNNKAQFYMGATVRAYLKSSSVNLVRQGGITFQVPSSPLDVLEAAE